MFPIEEATETHAPGTVNPAAAAPKAGGLSIN